ncbi:MAG: TIGR00341 family protein [Candidatus Cryptobacteroides sp.]
MKTSNKITGQIRHIVNLSEYIDTDAADRSIRSNIYFRGPNTWILAVAIIIASVGLNVNSIPVIIGAMLISPLMGPIFGIGLGLGITDTELLKQSAKNLLVMMIISLLTSFIYFLITPLNLTNPTELLARTNPTIYDVLIALFGGFAGILEQCRKEKGTVFSGVAIATALMPPLCTAGFGLASGNLTYFAGALYLFFINCLFITLATYITVKYLKFHQKEYSDATVGKRTRTIITVIVIICIVPSIWSAVNMVKQYNFEDRAISFLENNKTLGKCYVYDYKISHKDGSKIEIFLTGEPLSAAGKNNLIESAKEFGLKPEQLIINEHTFEKKDGNEMELVKGIYERTDAELGRRQAEIEALQKEISTLKGEDIPYVQITRELVNSFPNVQEVYISKGANVSVDSLTAVPCLLVITKSSKPMTDDEKTRCTDWLKIRMNAENVVLFDKLI